MKIRDYKKYFDTTTDDLPSEELKHLVNYFSLLGQVEKPIARLVIPVYIAKQTLLAYIVSLSNIRTIIPYEVFFIDNNADSITLNILEQLVGTVFTKSQQGITHARQKGLDCAKGNIICTIDLDTIYDPSYIDGMVLPFYEDKDLVLCYSITKSCKNDFQQGFKNHAGNWSRKTDVKWEFTQKFEKRIQYVQTCTKALHKNAFLPIGYPTDLKSLRDCDDGLIAVKLNPVVQYKYIPTNLFTVLPSPREKSKHYFFCNEKFYTFMIMTLILNKICFAQSTNTKIDANLLINEINGSRDPLHNLTENNILNLEQFKFCYTNSDSRNIAKTLKKKIRTKKIILKTNYELGVYKKSSSEQVLRRFAE
jgi:glycosyltransferase involved in cell wall biosynthesis